MSQQGGNYGQGSSYSYIQGNLENMAIVAMNQAVNQQQGMNQQQGDVVERTVRCVVEVKESIRCHASKPQENQSRAITAVNAAVTPNSTRLNAVHAVNLNAYGALAVTPKHSSSAYGSRLAVTPRASSPYSPSKVSPAAAAYYANLYSEPEKVYRNREDGLLYYSNGCPVTPSSYTRYVHY